jgi:RNA polymerase sigma-32 factor
MSLPAVTANTLELYQREVARFPVLSPEEEYDLATRWHDGGDVDAARQLVVGNLRFVLKIAHEYVKYGFPLVDLVQEGNVGMMKAVKKFDPYRGIRLISYAVYWIRAQIHDYIQKSWSMVRVATTRTQRKLFNMLQSTSSKLRKALAVDEASGDDDGLALSAVAEELNVDISQIQDMRQRTRGRDLSIDQPVSDDAGASFGDALPSDWADPEAVAEDSDTRARFAQALDRIRPTLNEREQAILDRRLLSEEPDLLGDLGEAFGVSKERVRQIEAALIKKLRKRLGEYGIDAL